MKKYTYLYITLLALFLMPLASLAQNDRQLIRHGNRLFREQKFEEAEATFRKAVAANPRNPEAQYNLGCALMAQQKDSMAVQCFENGAKMQPDCERRAQAYHNMGVICQQKKMFAEAVDAYKEALRNNPKDDETRYNLALCLKQLKNQPKKQNKQQQDKNKDDNKDKNKDKKDENKQDQNKQNQNKNQQQNKQPEQMSKDNAEQLLNAAKQQEQAVQQRMQKAKSQPRQNRHMKNW